jgi:hypothetical protein
LASAHRSNHQSALDCIPCRTTLGSWLLPTLRLETSPFATVQQTTSNRHLLFDCGRTLRIIVLVHIFGNAIVVWFTATYHSKKAALTLPELYLSRSAASSSPPPPRSRSSSTCTLTGFHLIHIFNPFSTIKRIVTAPSSFALLLSILI